MADRPLSEPLPADLPEDWSLGQIVAPEGADAGLSRQHGYNYLMAQVNAAQRAVNAVNESFDTISGKRTCRLVVGTSTAGWTQADCDYLCDGVDDHVEINAALADLKEYGGGEIVILAGEYDLAESVQCRFYGVKMNVALIGSPGATILNLVRGCEFGGMEEGCDFYLWGLTLKGKGTSQLNVNGAGATIQNCTFVNTHLVFSAGFGGNFVWGLDSSRIEADTSIESMGTIVTMLGDAERGGKVEITRNYFSVDCRAENTQTKLIMASLVQDCVVADNVALCSDSNWGITAERAQTTNNILKNVSLYGGSGGVISGNRMTGGYIIAASDHVSEDTQEKRNRRMLAVVGNVLNGAGIRAYGGVTVSGNTVNAPEGIAAIMMEIGVVEYNDPTNAGPVITGNFIAGGSIGIQLTKPSFLEMPYAKASHALITGNRIRDCETSIQIEENWSGCLVTNNLFDGSVVDHGTDNTIHLNNDDTVDSSGSAAAGVTSFNGRSGAVAPRAGDYTADMVGAVASGAVQTVLAVTQAEYDALAAKDAGTLYLIKE